MTLLGVRMVLDTFKQILDKVKGVT